MPDVPSTVVTVTSRDPAVAVAVNANVAISVVVLTT
jgi:hypothetical protein